MNTEFNDWWDEDDLTTQGNPFTDSTPAYWAWEGWCAGVKAEREACAKVCDDKAKETFTAQCQVWGEYFGKAIRARSNT